MTKGATKGDHVDSNAGSSYKEGGQQGGSQGGVSISGPSERAQQNSQPAQQSSDTGGISAAEEAAARAAMKAAQDTNNRKRDEANRAREALNKQKDPIQTAMQTRRMTDQQKPAQQEQQQQQQQQQQQRQAEAAPAAHGQNYDSGYDVDKVAEETGEVLSPSEAGMNPHIPSKGQIKQELSESQQETQEEPFIQGVPTNQSQQAPIASENTQAAPQQQQQQQQQQQSAKPKAKPKTSFKEAPRIPSIKGTDLSYVNPTNQGEAIVDNYSYVPDNILERGDEAVREYLVNSYQDKPRKTQTDLDVEYISIDEYNEGKRPKKENQPERFVDEDSIRRANQRMYNNPFLMHIDGESIEYKEVDGETYARISYPPPVQQAINRVRTEINEDLSIRRVLQIVYMRGGVSVGKHFMGTIGNKQNWKEYLFPSDVFSALAEDAIASYNEFHTPFALVKGKPDGVRDHSGFFVMFEGTKCYPAGFVPRDLAVAIGGNSYTGEAIQKNTELVFKERTYPLIKNHKNEKEFYQMRALETYNRSLANIDGTDYTRLGIPSFDDLKLSELPYVSGVTDDPDIQKATEEREKYIKESLAGESARFKKSARSKDSDGSISSIADEVSKSKKVGISGWCHYASKNIKGFGAMRLQLLGAGILESANNFVSQTQAMIYLRHKMPKELRGEFGMTDTLKSAFGSKQAVDALAIGSAIIDIDGMQGIQAYRAKGYKFTKEDFSKYVTELKGNQPSNAFTHYLDMVLDKAYSTMSGDIMFKRKLAKDWIELTLIEMARAKNKGSNTGILDKIDRLQGSMTEGQGTNVVYTNSQIEDSLNAGSIEDTIQSLFETDAGYDAMMWNGNQSFARKNPLAHITKRVVEKNGVTEFAIRTMFDKFPEYGVTKLQNMTPLSNTLSYLATIAGHKVGTAMNEEADGENAFQRIKDYQAGGRANSFADGLRKNLVYDTVMISNKIILGGIFFCILQALDGVYPPDDDELIWNWDEWCIGAPAKEGGFPIKFAWFMDDWSGIGLPLGMALSVGLGNQTEKNNLENAVNVFINAVTTFCDGSSVLDAIDLVVNADKNFQQLQQNLLDDRTLTPKDFGEFITGETVAKGADILGMFEPAFFEEVNPLSRDWILRGGDDRARTWSKVYGEDGKTEDVPDYITARLKQESMNNNWLALLGNLGGLITGGDTNWFYEQMPVSTLSDQYRLSMSQPWAIDLKSEDVPPITQPEEREAYLWGKASEAIKQMQLAGLINDDGTIDDSAFNGDYLSERSSIDKAIYNGFYMDYDTRVTCIAYCYAMIKNAEDEYFDYVQSADYANDSRPEQNAHWKKLQDTKTNYNTILYDWLKNDNLPWSAISYEKLESDNSYYYRHEDGSPATAWEYYGQALTGNKIEKVPYAYGNDPATILPLSSPRTGEGIGFNFETIPAWYHPQITDMEKVASNAKDLLILKGRDADKLLDKTILGGQGTHLDTGEEMRIDYQNGEAPTIDYRAYVPSDNSMPEDLKNPSAALLNGLLGIDASYGLDDEDDGKNGDKNNKTTNNKSGGSRSYGGGGGGSSAYNPKIYSNPRSVSSRSAQGMNVRQPYHRNGTYLRPNFETKGSREAYKRSDI